MPYIVKEDRKNYNAAIKQIIDTIAWEEDPLARAELLGFYCRTILKSYADPKDSEDMGKLNDRAKVIKQYCLIAVGMIKNRWRLSDYLSVAGDMNYLLSAVVWTIEENEDDPAKYGFRAMITGMLQEILENVSKWLAPTNTKRMIRGVISDVLDERYRRNTSRYEDKKIVENGDILPIEE